MKHARILLVLMFLMVASATVTYAQQSDTDGDGFPDTRDNCPDVAGPVNGCPMFIIAPQQPVLDTDGDGLPDTDDQCPNEAGPRENRGCPIVTPTVPTGPTNLAPNPAPDRDGDGVPDASDGCPDQGGPAHLSGCPDTTQDTDGDSVPDPVDNCPDVAGTPENGGCPPFAPPALPVDGCFVTPNGDFRVVVREQPDLNADVLGYLLPGVVYEAQGYVVVGSELWFVLSAYENSNNINGYASRSVLNASSCGEVDPTGAPPVRVVPLGDGSVRFVRDTSEYPWQVGVIVSMGEGIPQEPTETIEYCIYLEVQEAGVFEEVCYEIEIPEGCVLTTAEAGVYTVDCGDGDNVSLNPAIGDLPAVNVQGPSRNNNNAVVVGLNLIFNGEASNPGEEPEVIEYCIYQEVQEAGVFEEVCYEIEIPEGCVLTTAEAGVFTMECEDDTVIVNPILDNLPSNFQPVQRDPVPLGVGMQMIYSSGGTRSGGTDTIEYCVYEEVQEAGVFEEVCYEIEAPEGCVFVSSEAGVYTLECDNEPSLNPALGEMPAVDLIYPTDPQEPILIGLLLPAVQKVREAAR